MGRFRDSNDDSGADAGIDMSPMIDCVFILLIFFIVTTTFVDETGVEVDKPQAASAVRLEKSSILIAVTAKGEVVYGGHEIGIAAVQSVVRRMLQKEKVPVIVQGDNQAPYAVIVRVIDEAKLGGAEKVSLATAKNVRG